MNTIKIKILKRMAAHPPDEIVEVEADSWGTPLDLFWRRRLQDAKVDSCCEIVRPVASKPKQVTRTRKPVPEIEAEGDE